MGSGCAKNLWPWGKTVLALGTGGDDGLAAAKILEGAAGTAEGAGGTAILASSGATVGQQKVTSLCWPGGRLRCGSGTAGSMQGLRQLVETVSVLPLGHRTAAPMVAHGRRAEPGGQLSDPQGPAGL
jgi:hypothetical protein